MDNAVARELDVGSWVRIKTGTDEIATWLDGKTGIIVKTFQPNGWSLDNVESFDVMVIKGKEFEPFPIAFYDNELDRVDPTEDELVLWTTFRLGR